jgi:hypothetical protein
MRVVLWLLVESLSAPALFGGATAAAASPPVPAAGGFASIRGFAATFAPPPATPQPFSTTAPAMIVTTRMTPDSVMVHQRDRFRAAKFGAVASGQGSGSRARGFGGASPSRIARSASRSSSLRSTCKSAPGIATGQLSTARERAAYRHPFDFPSEARRRSQVPHIATGLRCSVQRGGGVARYPPGGAVSRATMR